MGTTDNAAANSAVRNLQSKTTSSLSGSVGFGGDNKPDDVRKVSEAMVANGRIDQPTSDATDAFNSKIITAQQDMADGLRPDAEINPNGPTIQKLDQMAGTRNATKRRKERRDERRADAAASGKRNAIDQIKHDATRWHFEDREAKNKPLPNSMRRVDRAGFEMYPQWQNEYHQNNIGEPEVKYAHPDGREVIYDGDTRKVVADPELKGTFNYANAPARKEKPENTEEWMRYLFQNGALEHILYDIAPFEIEEFIRRMKSDKK